MNNYLKKKKRKREKIIELKDKKKKKEGLLQKQLLEVGKKNKQKVQFLYFLNSFVL